MEGKTFGCYKLGRDKCLELFKKQKIAAKSHKIKGKAYIAALKKKINRRSARGC